MFLRKICFFCFLCVILSHISYAQELTAAEAVNYYNEGVRAQKNGDFDTAMKAYQKALLLSSYYNKFCLNNQAAIYAQVGDYKRAEALLKEVIAMDPDYMPAKLNLGLIYDSYGDKKKALEFWAEVFQIEKRKPKTFVADAEQSAPK